MLSPHTQIPTHARGQVRALVKAHKHWKVFLHKKGLISASAKNADLIEFALFYPELTAGIEALLGLMPTTEQAERAIQTRNIECLRQLPKASDEASVRRLRQLLKIAEKQFA